MLVLLFCLMIKFKRMVVLKLVKFLASRRRSAAAAVVGNWDLFKLVVVMLCNLMLF